MISAAVCAAALGCLADAASEPGFAIPGISPAGVTQLLIASIVIIAVPGPSVMFLIGHALGAGRRSALTSVAGNSLGMALTAIVMALGVGAVVSRSPLALSVIRIGGGLLLVAIGVRYLLAAAQHSDRRDTLGQSASRRTVVWSSVGVGMTKTRRGSSCSGLWCRAS
ncbi:MAG: LysE family transporter [Tetrasphaera sp.]